MSQPSSKQTARGGRSRAARPIVVQEILQADDVELSGEHRQVAAQRSISVPSKRASAGAPAGQMP